ncbi:hypothetical protein CDEST_06061 [Colletotrichum destructivum]|uniref:Uncharacterized protein n=1 Tax=Colletotrichum destructivum TaxID=34406 RepID=A0AAX4ICT9_9PEZI|nr:hypothetical protein CDEST_06061 [Colletotrichum destructivum]
MSKSLPRLHFAPGGRTGRYGTQARERGGLGPRKKKPPPVGVLPHFPEGRALFWPGARWDAIRWYTYICFHASNARSFATPAPDAIDHSLRRKVPRGRGQGIKPMTMPGRNHCRRAA